jgi:DNA-binding CsgD family transcriptional regulator
MKFVKEPKRKSVPVQKSHAFKEELRVGGEIAAMLPQVMSQTEVAAQLGISQQMISRIERRALYKLRMLLRESLKAGVNQDGTINHHDVACKTEVVESDNFCYSFSDE